MLQRSRLLLIVAVSLLQAPTASAIVLRHDRPDDDYIALAKRFPSAVAILPDGSGTLVAPRFILTAAHVADGVAHRQPRVEIDGREVAVDRIFVHPAWSGRGAPDVALLRLAEPIDEITPAALFRGDDEAGRIVTFVGRGDTGTGVSGPEKMDRKKRGATNRIDDVDSDWIYFTFDQGADATQLEGVSGPGDSGGPAFILVDDEVQVVGVSVFSFNGKPGHYGTREAYTRVSAYAEWIDSIVSGDSEDLGVAPQDRTTRAVGGEARSVPRPGIDDRELSDVPGGELVEGYVRVLNSGDGNRFFEYLQRHSTEDYLGRKTQEEHVAIQRRLLDVEFGSLQVTGIVEASGDRLVVRVEGDNGVEGELHFSLAGERIDGLMVAKIDAVRR